MRFKYSDTGVKYSDTRRFKYSDTELNIHKLGVLNIRILELNIQISEINRIGIPEEINIRIPKEIII